MSAALLFGQHTVDKTMDEHLREIATLASDPQTLVVLDTNILAYLYKLHEAARQEFFNWSDSVVSANRLAIPGWAASEYLSRVTARALDSYTPKSKEPNQAKKAMDSLYEVAALFVDDSLLGRMGLPGDRAAYLTGFRQAIDALDPYIRAFSHQFDPGVIHQQIVDHLALSILDSDLAALCARADREGPARFEHRLPPGFRDESKEQNRFGDLIIWFEILELAVARAAAFPKVLFITNDEKSDWVYAPRMRKELVSGTKKTVGNSNPEIRLADPRLISEFHRQTGSEQVVIASLATLVEGLSKVSATLFAQLAAAIQINNPAVALTANVTAASDDNLEELSILTTPTEPEIAPVEAVVLPAEQQAEPAEPETPAAVDLVEPQAQGHDLPAAQFDLPRLNYQPEALADSQYPSDAPSDINAVIRALKSLNWYTQNPAITSIRSLRQEEFTPAAWFVLGRNIYQAACGNAQKAMEFMAALETQLQAFPEQTAQHILAGMLYEIYFDGNGEFRGKAKFSYADKPLALVTDQRFSDVQHFVQFHLNEHQDRLKFLPGDRDQKILVVRSIPRDVDDDISGGATFELESVILDGIELICDVADDYDDAWARMLGQSKMRTDALRSLIAESLAIPKWALATRYEPPIPPNSQFVLPEGRKLDPRLALAIAAPPPD